MRPFAAPDATLEKALQPLLHPAFSFVNIGASDGVSNDPVYPFILKYGWTGLLVEPVPHVFHRLRQNYASFGGMRFENALIANEACAFHFLPEDYCNNRPWARQIGSTDPERVRWALTYIAKEGIFDGARFDDLERLVSSSALPCLSFPDLMKKHDVRRFDLLNIDTEGSDLEILESVDLIGYDVRAVVVETRPHFHDNRIASLLADLGFEFIKAIDWATDAFVRHVR